VATHALALGGQVSRVLEDAQVQLGVEIRVVDALLALLVTLHVQIHDRFGQVQMVQEPALVCLVRGEHHRVIVIVDVLVSWQTHRHPVLVVIDRFLSNGSESESGELREQIKCLIYVQFEEGNVIREGFGVVLVVRDGLDDTSALGIVRRAYLHRPDRSKVDKNYEFFI
jgi:hypothetical protein